MVGNRNTIGEEDLDCIKKSPSHIAPPQNISRCCRENPGAPQRGSNWGFADFVLPGPLPRDPGFRIHSEQGFESQRSQPATQDSSQTRPAHQAVCKKVPGHHVQVDVKFLKLKDTEGNAIKRYPYTAIDDATRIRALQIYRKHNQACAIKFIDYVVEKFPFRIGTVRTDRGHEFQARFNWHIEDQGMKHVYIKPRSPQLNGKVERSHRTDQTEFYQLLTYTDDVDLNAKLEAWENFYNYDRPHISLDGKTPYEVMRFILNNSLELTEQTSSD